MATLILLFAAAYKASSIKIEWMKQTNIINVSNQCEFWTTNIAAMNDKYFLISYANATGDPANFLVSSMVGQIYDVQGDKINTETIILAYAPPSTTAVFRMGPAQCQCNHNSDKEIKNNLMYGWMHETDNFWTSNASYKILYPSNYDPSTNPNKLNGSEWIIADDTNINQSQYSADQPVCACLEDGTFAYFWINSYFNEGTQEFDEYEIFIDQNGNNINGKNQYIIQHLPPYSEIYELLPCITPPNATKACDTYLGIVADFYNHSDNGYGMLYSVSEKGKTIKDHFKINQHATKHDKNAILAAISLSNGLYAILYIDVRVNDVNLLFLENENATQLAVNGKDQWSVKVNFDQQNFVFVKMKEIQDESNGDMIYLCIIYSDEISIYGTVYAVTRNNDEMINAQIIGDPFEIYAKPRSNTILISWINLETIGKTMMVGWSENFTSYFATILTLNITES